jgi:hypothetical protein
MMHPSTMAGTNWFTGSFGTPNPFASNPFLFSRNMPFQGQQGGFGFGTLPFPNQSFGFGTGTTQMQNTINEIVRQTVPTLLANWASQPGTGFQTPFGFQPPWGQTWQAGFPWPWSFQGQAGFTPSWPQFQTSPWMNFTPWTGDWQNPLFTGEIVRQATNQILQSLQQNPTFFSQGAFSPGQPFFGTTPSIGTPGTFPTFQQQSFGNLIGQICQAVTSCVMSCLAQATPAQNTFFTPQTSPFQTPGMPFNFNTTTSQFGATSGTPTGAGAF